MRRTFIVRVEMLVVAGNKAKAEDIIDAFLGDETIMDHRIVNGPDQYFGDTEVPWRKRA